MGWLRVRGDFAEVWEYARDRGTRWVNAESVSIHKVEIEASVELLRRLPSWMKP